MVLLCNQGWPRTHYAAHVVLELAILLPQPPKLEKTNKQKNLGRQTNYTYLTLSNQVTLLIFKKRLKWKFFYHTSNIIQLTDLGMHSTLGQGKLVSYSLTQSNEFLKTEYIISLYPHSMGKNLKQQQKSLGYVMASYKKSLKWKWCSFPLVLTS
jgi:hypothetical protein